MPQWVQDIIDEWPKIMAAPRSFAVVTVLIIGAAWIAINWSYRAVLSRRDSQIAALKNEIGDYQQKLQGKTPDQIAGEISSLRDQLTDTKKQLAALANPSRDPNSIYQNGKRVGVVAGVRVDTADKVVTFAQVTVGGELDQAKNVEFRDLILAFIGSDDFSQVRQGLATTITYGKARFSIEGKRSD